MRNHIENIVPGFGEKCMMLHSDPIFNFSLHETEIIIMMIYDYEPCKIASLFSRDIKTIYKHRENSLKKTGCNTYFAMAIKIKKFFPWI